MNAPSSLDQLRKAANRATVAEAVAIFGISRWRLEAAIRRGLIPVVGRTRRSRAYLIDLTEVEAMLAVEREAKDRPRQMLQLWNMGASVFSIAADFGVSQRTVQRALKPHRGQREDLWSAQEDEVLTTSWGQGWSNIADRLPGRSRGAASLRVRLLRRHGVDVPEARRGRRRADA